MTRPTRFIELCGASLCTTLRLGWEVHKITIPMWGSKFNFLDALLPAMRVTPGMGADSYLAVEPGPYGEFWQVVKNHDDRAALVSCLKSWQDTDPSTLWERIAKSPVPDGILGRVCHWSTLQFWGYGRKIIYPVCVAGTARDGLIQTHTGHARRWKTHGMDQTAPYNREYREKRGEGVGRRNVRLPDLIERIEALPELSSLTVLHCSALEVDPTVWGGPGVLVLIDPPYEGTEGYGEYVFSRADVVRVARVWATTGARVVICEAEPITMGTGWQYVEITQYLKGRGRTNGCREWLTMNFAPGDLPTHPADNRSRSDTRRRRTQPACSTPEARIRLL